MEIIFQSFGSNIKQKFTLSSECSPCRTEFFCLFTQRTSNAFSCTFILNESKMLAIVKMQWKLKELFLKMRLFCREETPQTPIYVFKKQLTVKIWEKVEKKTQSLEFVWEKI